MIEQMNKDDFNKEVTINIDNNETIVIKEDGIYNYVFETEKSLEVNLTVLNNIKAVINIYYFKNDMINLNISLEDNSEVYYYVFNYYETDEKVIINLNENSYFYTYLIELGEYTKSNYEINLLGSNSNLDYNLAVYADHNIEKEHYIKVNHLSKNTKSIINNYGVLDDKAISVFDVSSFIKKKCVDSDTYQKTKVLSLSDDCQTHINPILLIDEYDVAAGHAAVVSRINEEEMYYFNSRGIDDDTAKKIISLGFLLKKAPTNIIDELTAIIERRMDDGKIST